MPLETLLSYVLNYIGLWRAIYVDSSAPSADNRSQRSVNRCHGLILLIAILSTVSSFLVLYFAPLLNRAADFHIFLYKVADGICILLEVCHKQTLNAIRKTRRDSRRGSPKIRERADVRVNRASRDDEEE